MNNYDTNELNKFASLSVHWWDPAGELKTLHQINPLRLGFIEEKVNLTNKKVIDIGCGGGILAESMAAKGANVTGIDLTPALIDTAKLHLLESGLQVDYQVIAAETIAAKEAGQYDVVVCYEMLEHVPDPQAIVKACSDLVKSGGHVFFSTLNRNLKSYALAIIGGEYILKLLPRGTHDYAKFIRPSELAHFARGANLQPQDMRGIHYQPFTKQFTLTSDTSVNYLFYATKNP